MAKKKPTKNKRTRSKSQVGWPGPPAIHQLSTHADLLAGLDPASLGNVQKRIGVGKLHTGMLVRTVLDDYTYLDPQGKLFKLNTRAITASRPLPQSIMPTGLPDLLTDQELRDLLAYLESRR